MFCMHYSSTSDKPKIFRYTSIGKRQRLKKAKYSTIQATLPGADAARAACDAMLQAHVNGVTHYAPEFARFLQHQALHDQALSQHYTHPHHRKLRLNTFMNTASEEAKLLADFARAFPGNPVIVWGDYSMTFDSRPPQKESACDASSGRRATRSFYLTSSEPPHSVLLAPNLFPRSCASPTRGHTAGRRCLR